MTKEINFCHLHTHNTFSLLDGMGQPEEWAEKAKELGYQYLALTNHGNADGLIKHQNACEKFGINAIHGVEFYIVPDPEIKEKGEKRGHLTVWIKNQKGYQNVLKMLTMANLHYFYYRPRIGYSLFLEHCEGLCVGTACSSSFLNLPGGVEFFHALHEKIGEDLYLEVMPHDYQEQIDTNNLCLELAEKTGVKLIATHDSHYVGKEDWDSHDVLLACQTKKKINDPDRWKFNRQDFYLCESTYIREGFEKQDILYPEEIQQAMSNTIEVAEKCKDFKINKKKIILPTPPQFQGLDEETILRNLCEEGFVKRFGVETQEYRDRFEYELSVIKDFEVIKYFLIVYDLVNWCRENNILTGPGRGSAAGCLISYLLGITKIDPIKYGLLFERFLNPGRKGAMPDIDLDFEDIKRGEVIKYLRETYGANHIAGITTYLKLEDKGIIREVSRAFDLPLHEADTFSKAVVDTVENALLSETGVEFNAKHPEVVKHILKLKGTYKAYGRHASALLISPEDLTLGTRASLAERNDQLVTSLDGNDCENQGLVKLDVLGLSTLSVIAMCLDLIKKNHGKNIDLEKINLEDKEIYKNISAGNTVGCFQINTWALTRLIKDMGVKDILQLSDAVALVRPGAFDSGATANYIARKKGKEWIPKHPIYEEITKKTFGVVAYQEQVIFVINKIAGLSLTVADAIRKIIGKKRDPKEFEKYKDQFVKGCLEQNTFTEEEANEFWEELGHHANYSFNLSHSLSYAVVAYWTAWLKHYYPHEFLCAALTHGGEAEKHNLIREAQRLGLEISTPRLGSSDARYWTVKDRKLYIPFIEAKGIGPAALEAIESYSKPQGGFFVADDKPVFKKNIKAVLDNIGAFGGEVPEEIDNYFDLGIPLNPKAKYRKLFALVEDGDQYNINDLLTGNISCRCFGKENSSKELSAPELYSCSLCELRVECEKPQLPRRGIYNLLIINETPHWADEDNHKILFKEFSRYGFEKEDFGLTNFIKCTNVRKPTKEQVRTCGDKWVRRELLNNLFVLAFGNAAVNFFLGEDSGIMKYNGQTIWSEEYGCWVSFCIPTNFVSWKPLEFKKKWREGIKNYIELLENVGGFK